MKVAFFGGSFDPIHHGHLIAAQDAFEQLGLQSLCFMPTAQAPLRDDAVRASAEQRLHLIRLAIGEDRRFSVSDLEIRRGGVSYTIDTVEQILRENPATEPVWIIGEDQLGKLPRWHRAEELCRLTEFAWLQRPGNAQPTVPGLPGLRLHRLTSHQVELSSSEIRHRIRENRPVRFLLPDPAIQYINEQRLYR